MTRRISCWYSRAAASAVFSLSLSIAAPAFADDVEVLFKDGVVAAEAGQTEVAYRKLLAALELRKTYDIAASLGVVENAMGKYRDAAEHIDFALKNFPPVADSGTRASLAATLGDLKKKVGTMEIATAAGATVELDGVALGAAPIEGSLFVEPGRHVLIARQADGGEGKLEFEIKAGESRAARIEIVKPVSTGPVVAPSSGRPLWPAFVGFGVAAAGVGVGISGFVLSAQGRSNAEDLATAIQTNGALCLPEGAQPSAACDEAVSSLEDSQNFQTMGIVGMSVGGAALAFAVVYMVFPDDSSDESAAQTAGFTKAGLTQAGITPWFGPDGGGFAVSGRF